MWRKNRRNNGDGTWGVDLNRNFGFQWGFDDLGSSRSPAALNYRGPAPFSEPETQHLRDFITSQDFVFVVDYHSYSNLILWPWGFKTLLTPDNDIFTAVGDSIAALNGYTPGPIFSKIFPPANGNSLDWEYGEQAAKSKAFAFAPEVGGFSDGFGRR